MTPPILDFPDPEKGRAMFEDVYGKRGPQQFRLVLKIVVPLAVMAAVLFLIAQITGATGTIVSAVRGWFSPLITVELPKQPQPSSKSPAPPGTRSCEVSGGTNYGKIEQTCAK